MKTCLSLLVLLLSLPVFARPPEDVVRQVYSTHLRRNSLEKTVAEVPKCFTPGFLGVIKRALARTPQSGGSYVDADFFVNSQGGWGDYKVGPASITGKDAVVPITLWTGLRSEAVRTDPVKRKSWPTTQAKVYLTDVGDGFQIHDLEFLPRAGEKFSFRVRPWLEGIASGKR